MKNIEKLFMKVAVKSKSGSSTIFHIKQIYFDKNYIYVTWFDNGYCCSDDISKDYITILRCSGMKDKHGTLIYEGDIIKYGGTVYTVYFCNHINGFFIKDDKDFEYQFWNDVDMVEFTEIIGNIHEIKNK